MTEKKRFTIYGIYNCLLNKKLDYIENLLKIKGRTLKYSDDFKQTSKQKTSTIYNIMNWSDLQDIFLS